ncbi:hypothetical protein [Paenibacillus naphthalenovorans]|uniref:Uncharacterized protein n=1 Tax=Paenibacillus naphthalenovorans TaxID=162209 RepID=A0A0U2KYT5_9BACL|nr:hypothetical protein [Paenibacillus naphthalenovorans]ALS22114.1 hypothetical protein IJ22_17400 [Paenibacillus naphthalenovorans]
MENIILKVRADSKAAIAKLSQYRQKGDIQNYKSMCDSIEILINMHNKNFRNVKVNEKTQEFLEDIIVKLNDEISLLSNCMDSLLQKEDVRDYRNYLISLDRLTSIHEKTKGEYFWNARNERLRLNQ